jgi:hypothetical protein
MVVSSFANIWSNGLKPLAAKWFSFGTVGCHPKARWRSLFFMVLFYLGFMISSIG